MVDAVSSNSAAGTQAKSEQSRASIANDKQDFLNLLVAQIKNQDPLEPTDPTEFSAQLVRYAGIEQQIQTNSNLESLVKMQKTMVETIKANNNLGIPVEYVGKFAEVAGNKMPMEKGVGTAWYRLDRAAGEVTIKVTNNLGDVVYKGSGGTLAGKNKFEWNGRNNDGKLMPNGVYTIDVQAIDKNNKTVKVSDISTATLITAAYNDDGTPMVVTDRNQNFKTSDLLSVRAWVRE